MSNKAIKNKTKKTKNKTDYDNTEHACNIF